MKTRDLLLLAIAAYAAYKIKQTSDHINSTTGSISDVLTGTTGAISDVLTGTTGAISDVSDIIGQIDSGISDILSPNLSSGGWTSVTGAGGFSTASSGGGGFTTTVTQSPVSYVQGLVTNAQIATAIQNSINQVSRMGYTQNIVGGDTARQVIEATAAYLRTTDTQKIYDALHVQNALFDIPLSSINYAMTVLANSAASFNPNNYINKSYADAAAAYYSRFPALLSTQYLDASQAYLFNLIAGAY